MFIEPKPLKNNKIKLEQIGFVFKENTIASAVQFYKNYRSNIKKLMQEKKDIWNKWIGYYNNLKDSTYSTYVKDRSVNNLIYINKYNDWLFDYTFSDVIY